MKTKKILSVLFMALGFVFAIGSCSNDRDPKSDVSQTANNTGELRTTSSNWRTSPFESTLRFSKVFDYDYLDGTFDRDYEPINQYILPDDCELMIYYNFVSRKIHNYNTAVWAGKYKIATSFITSSERDRSMVNSIYDQWSLEEFEVSKVIKETRRNVYDPDELADYYGDGERPEQSFSAKYFLKFPKGKYKITDVYAQLTNNESYKVRPHYPAKYERVDSLSNNDYDVVFFYEYYNDVYGGYHNENLTIACMVENAVTHQSIRALLLSKINPEHGKIWLSNPTSEEGYAIQGDKISVDVVPDEGYEVNNVYVNGKPLPLRDAKINSTTGELSTSFIINENSVVTAEVVKKSPKVRMCTVFVEDHSNGNIRFIAGGKEYVNDGFTVPEGTEITVISTPDEGYNFSELSLIDGITGDETIINESNYTFKITQEELYINPVFVKKLYTEIKVGDHTNGNLRFTVGDKVYVNEGFVVERGTPVTVEAIVINPKDYYFNGFTIDKKVHKDEKLTPRLELSMSMDISSYEIGAVFDPIPSLKYQVDVQSTANGLVQLSESGLVDKDSEVEVYATANAGYKVGGIYVNGKLIDGSSFKVKANSRVKVVFNKI